MTMHYIDTVMNPAPYSGGYDQGPYFEGWYYKLVDRTGRHRIAIIPGIYRETSTEAMHPFIQVIGDTKVGPLYHEFPFIQFEACPDTFEIQIARSRFTSNCVLVDFEHNGHRINGELQFDNLTPWEITLLTPGTMGPFAWLPGIGCYHNVLSFDHSVTGTLSIDGHVIDFSGGRGYLEKDHGRGFPPSYVWMQTNHFSTYSTSLETAIAAIPVLGGVHLRGMECGFQHGGELYRFATYTGARLERFNVTDRAVYITYRDRVHRLEIMAERAKGTLVYTPERGAMHQRVKDTLNARVHVELTARVGHSVHTIFRGTGHHAGLEVHGDIERLLNYFK